MEVSREMIRTFTFIAGPLVLVSYGLALSKMDDKAALWGGIPKFMDHLHCAIHVLGSDWIPDVLVGCFIPD